MTVHAPETDRIDDPEQLVAEGPDAGGSRRPLIAGGLAGMWALLVGVAVVTCLVMLAWAVSPNSAGDSAAAWRAAGVAWLGAHLVPLTISGQPVTLLPIGALLLGLLLTHRGGAWSGRLLSAPSSGEVVGVVSGSALVYAAGGAGVAWLSAGASALAVPAQAFVICGLVAAAGTLWGLAPEAGLVDAARERLSDAAWRTLLAGLAATVGMVGVGAALVTTSLIVNFAHVGNTLAELESGTLGAAGLTLLGALSLPNLDIWAMSLLVGPGFDIGPIGGLSAFGGEVATLPALPVLAAIPATAPAWAPALLLVPVLLGLLAGRIRWGRDLPTLTGALLGAVALGSVVAALVAGLVALSSGSLGGGRLSDVGPALIPVTAAATGLVVLGFLADAGFKSLRLTWELHQAEQRAAALRAGAAVVEETTPVVDLRDNPSEDDPWGTGEADVKPAEGHAAPQPAGRARWTAVTGVFLTAGAAVGSRLPGASAAAEGAADHEPEDAPGHAPGVAGDVVADAGVDQAVAVAVASALAEDVREDVAEDGTEDVREDVAEDGTEDVGDAPEDLTEDAVDVAEDGAEDGGHGPADLTEDTADGPGGVAVHVTESVVEDRKELAARAADDDTAPIPIVTRIAPDADPSDV